jgi:hypothetical protein
MTLWYNLVRIINLSKLKIMIVANVPLTDLLPILVLISNFSDVLHLESFPNIVKYYDH